MNLPYVSGRAYFTPGSYTTFLTGADKAYALPFVPSSRGFTPDRIGVNVTTAGSGANADVRLGIYEDNNGRPGRLVNDFGAVAGLTDTGEYKIDIVGALRPFLWGGKLYWLVAAFDGAATTQPTVAALATSVVPQAVAASLGVASLANLPSAVTAAGIGLTADHTFGALPSEGSSLTWSVVTNAAVPLVGLRAA